MSEDIGIITVMPQANLGGGAEVMLLNFLIGLREVRPEWRCLVIFLRPGPFVKILEQAGFRVASILNVRLRNPVNCFYSLLQLVRQIKRHRADVVFSWVSYGQLFGGTAGLLAGVPAVWYQIGFAKGLLDLAATILPASRILSVSHHTAIRQSKICPKHRALPVWPGIDVEAFSDAAKEDRARLRIRLNLPVKCPVAVMVGRLQRWKGMHTVIAAMPAVRVAFPNALLVIVGGSHDLERGYPDELKRMIERLGLENSVIMAGSQNNIAEWMTASDVVVHASMEEPFGIVAIEAMACGRPVITGNNGGVIEAVRDGIEGIHVPYGDHTLLGKALLRIFGDPVAASKMGSRGLERAGLFTRRRYAENICHELEASVKRNHQTKSK